MVLLKRILRCCVPLCALISSLPGNIGATSAKPIRRVLIINEVSTAWPGIPLIDQGIRSALESSPYKVDVYREYLDTIYFPDSADQQRFREFYIRKYEDHRPDVIITVGPSPLKFMVETHTKAFPGVPIVFCLPNWAPGTPTQAEFAGVENEISPVETLEAAFRLNPATKHVVVVGGVSVVDLTYMSVVKEKLRPYEAKYGISYAPSLSMPDLVERLNHLPTDTIVLFGSFSLDAAGSKFTSGGASAIVTAGANVPVFTLADASVNHGEVGGKVSSLQDQGRLAGELAVRGLNGEELQRLPKIRAPTTFMFDWRALKRWDFKERDLPANSIVLNRQPTLWDSYKWYIVAGVCLLLVQTSLIGGLLWQRATRRKAEAARKESEDRLGGIVQTAMDAIIAIDEKQQIVLFNHAAEKMFGCLRQEVLGTTIERFIPQRFRPKHAEGVQRFGASGVTARLMSSRGVLCAMRTNGEEFPIEASISHTETDGKKIFTVIIRDITERLQAETAIKESEERFRLVANTAPVMIWTTGTDKLCNYVNKPWLDFTGRTFEQEVGNGWAEGIHSEDVDNCLRKYMEAFDNREQFELEYRIRRHDGEYRWVYDIGVPRFNKDGAFAGYIGSCLDVTERKRAEEALSTIGRRLIEAHEEERTWIGRELHDDINQRLALLAIELERWIPEASTNEVTELVRHTLARVTEIAQDVQGLSHRLHSSKLDYLGLAAAAKGFCRELSEKTKVEIVFQHVGLPHTLSKEVSLCLFRVLQEALQNAVKHSGVRTFCVELHGTEESIELTVADTGSGFEEQEAYTRHGLGLISMRERLQLVHGELSVKSQPGAGTTIRARVPLNDGYQAMAG